MKPLLVSILFGIVYASVSAFNYEESAESIAKRTLNDGAYFQAGLFGTRNYTKSIKYNDSRGLYCMDINFMTTTAGRVFETLCYLGSEEYEVIDGFSTR